MISPAAGLRPEPPICLTHPGGRAAGAAAVGAPRAALPLGGARPARARAVGRRDAEPG
jgi:hypothetical protein